MMVAVGSKKIGGQLVGQVGALEFRRDGGGVGCNADCGGVL